MKQDGIVYLVRTRSDYSSAASDVLYVFYEQEKAWDTANRLKNYNYEFDIEYYVEMWGVF